MGILVLLLLMGSPAAGQPALHTEAITYNDGDLVLEGFLAYDPSANGKRPAVAVIPEWRGVDDYARTRVRQLAEMGYIALAVDMYGKGIVAKTSDEASKLATPFYKDRELMRHRARVGLDVLKRQSLADTSRTAVIGFCFGGTCAMELAMSGADLDGVVTFHGVLDFPKPEDTRNIKGAVLILDGGEDPYVPPEKVTGFWGAMKTAGVNYQINVYGGAVHSFTNPASGSDKSTGVAYNERAATRAWRDMQEFFKEIFRAGAGK